MAENSAVLFANDAFYLAFQTRDIPAMEEIWADDDQIACLHPGWPPLHGREEVIESWAGILASPSSPQVEILDPKAYVFGDTAFVICFEVIAGDALIATNYFRKIDGAWKLTHHQAGPTSGPLPNRTESNDNAPTTLQ